MIVVANRFHVAEEYEEEFLERFENRMGTVEEMDGFVRFELLTPVEHGHVSTDTHVALTYWESREAFEAWTDSEAFREAHSNRPPEGWFTGENELEIHEVEISAE